LPPAYSIRLTLAFKFSAFYYDIIDKPDRARHLAMLAFDDVIPQLDTFSRSKEFSKGTLSELCADIIDVLEKHLVPSATAGESEVFFHKMYVPSSFLLYISVTYSIFRMGDYHLYLAQFKSGDKRKDSADKLLEACKSDSHIPVAILPPTHPVRLGLALNLAIFHFEILNNCDRAPHAPRQASNDTFPVLGTKSEEHAALVLFIEVLRERLAGWMSQNKCKRVFMIVTTTLTARTAKAGRTAPVARG
jgi:14-3-3 protein epsilon